MNDLYQNSRTLKYYQFPQFLLRTPVSQTAKMLYMLLYDRTRLSQKNGRTAEDGRVFAVFPVRELAQRIGKSMTTVKASLRELETSGLLTRESGGFGRASRLYIRYPTEPETRPSYGRKAVSMTGGFPSPSKTINSKNNNSQNRAQPAQKKWGRRKTAFEDYGCSEEESF